MMRHAMGIKSSQMEQDRRKFEHYPQFLQNTMWMSNEQCLELRKLPVGERLAGAAKLKEEGNELFRKQAYAGAVECYEAALGAFRYLKQLDPEWKSKGIKDETIDFIDEIDGVGKAQDEAHQKAVYEFATSCYNNLAACFLGRASAKKPEVGSTIEEDYKKCVQACTNAIEIDEHNSKALYRRARALSEPMTATDADTDAAIRDLTDAAAAAPEDKAVRSLLVKLKKARAEAKKKDASALKGLFSKSEIYDEKTLAAQQARAEEEKRLNEPLDQARTPEDCEREAREAEAAVAHLRARGRHQDAAELEKKVADHRRQLDEYKTAAAQAEAKAKRNDPRNMDFANPTPEQIADAKEHGIDLLDPLVKKELQRLQRQKEFGGEEDDDDDCDEAGDDGATGGRRQLLEGGSDGEVPSMYRGGKMQNRLNRVKRGAARDAPESDGDEDVRAAQESGSGALSYWVFGVMLAIGFYRVWAVLNPELQEQEDVNQW